MTFLNPLVLFGLAAAAIPLILHLLNLRKLRTIEFSTLAFLKELQQTKIRRLKLRQIILLLLRTLLLVCIVLAFARPALRGTFLGALGGTQSHATVVIILDDSYSMEASDEHGERLRQAKEAAGKIAALLREGDEAYLLKLSDLPKATIAPATHDAGLLRTAIGETQASAVRRPVTDALRLASQLLARSTNVNREIYLVSDLQESLFPAVPQEDRPSFNPRTRLFIVPVGRAAVQNAGIDSVEVMTTILERDKPAAVRAWIRNCGASPLTNAVLTATLDGTTAAQTNVTAAPGSSTAVELTVVPKRSGFLAGSIELEHDALDVDNRRAFTMYIPDRISVALAGADDASNRFLLAALGAGGGGGPAAAAGLLDVRQVAADKLPQLDLRHVDVLICSNLREPAPSDAVRIRSFVEEGGGLVLFPGADAAAYNAALLPALGIPPVAGTSESSAGLSWGHVDVDHPLFATVFEEDPLRRNAGQRNIESPVVHRMLRREAGRKARTVIALADGSPFLSEHEAGRGKVLFYSVPPTLAWSDFPVKGLFAPLLYRSMIYASPKEHRERSFIAGAEPVVAIPNNAAAAAGADRQFALSNPDGVEEILQPEAAAGAGFSAPVTFRLPRLALPGVYRLHAGTTPLALYAVNLDGKESDTRPAAAEDLSRFWPSAGLPVSSVAELRPGEEIQAAVLQSRFGIELWKYFIGLALLAALAEMIVARESRAETAPA